MAKHTLSLDIPEILNTCIIRVIDTSNWNPDVPYECPKLEITPPGFNLPFTIENLPQGFIRNFTACDLGIQSTNCSTFQNDLSDGVWILRWSVSPNDKVFVEYNHLRTTNILNKYYKLLCCLDIRGCDPTKEIQQQLKEAQFIKTLIDAAKAKVEFCHEPRHGMDIYRYACIRLDKLACLCNCTC
jgi:hypothetical protein